MELTKILTKIFLVLNISREYSAHSIKVTTLTRIQKEGYTAERHQIVTSDGYILTVFRIPNGKVTAAETPEQRPLVLIVHGLLSCSDGWVLNAPNQALPYLLADEGYDVWLGNCRGNTYSRNHTKYSTWQRQFWRFSFHEIGIYDLPAIIDYMLSKTGQTQLDYIGHSQGTTSLFAMLSTKPAYNDKIKSAQLLAPVMYLHHAKSPLKVIGPLLGHPSALTRLFGSKEFVPNNELLALLRSILCKDKSPLQLVCSNVLFLIGGYDFELENRTLLPEIVKTHPAGCSVDQLIHYGQVHQSHIFRQYDFGRVRNLLKYHNRSPPEYNLSAIRVKMYAYYSENDWLAAVVDVQNLLHRLSNVEAIKMKHKKWNHIDYLWALDVRKRLYETVLKNMKK